MAVRDRHCGRWITLDVRARLLVASGRNLEAILQQRASAHVGFYDGATIQFAGDVD